MSKAREHATDHTKIREAAVVGILRIAGWLALGIHVIVALALILARPTDLSPNLILKTGSLTFDTILLIFQGAVAWSLITAASLIVEYVVKTHTVIQSAALALLEQGKND